MKYYKNDNGTHRIYDDQINKTIPEDAVSLTDDEYALVHEALKHSDTITVDESNKVVITPREIPTAEMAKSVRAKRDRFLLETDWTQVADSPLYNDPDMLAYRQALRDITAQVGFPFNVVFPVKP